MRTKKQIQEYKRKYRIENEEKIREYKKNYYLKNIIKIKAYKKKNMKNIKEKSKVYYEKNCDNLREKALKTRKRKQEPNYNKKSEYQKNYRKNNKIKTNSRHLALKIEIPKNQLCENCKKELATDRHHEDYNKPLEVKFLCRSCHYKLNRKYDIW